MNTKNPGLIPPLSFRATRRINNTDNRIAFVVIYSCVIHGDYLLRANDGTLWLYTASRRSSNRLSCYLARSLPVGATVNRIVVEGATPSEKNKTHRRAHGHPPDRYCHSSEHATRGNQVAVYYNYNA